MLTPHFSCSQTVSALIVSVYVPSVRAADVEIHVDGTHFSLYIHPYFLRLNLPKRVQEDENSSAQYDPSTGYLTITLSKEVPGEHFDDLDLLTKLLAPKVERKQTDGPVIEVIDEEDNVEHHSQSESKNVDLKMEHEIFLEAAKNDWRFPQYLAEERRPQLATAPKCNYGFLDRHSGYFRHAAYAEVEANELGPDAEVLTEEERRRRGEERVRRKFDEDYYLADFVNDEEIQELIRWRHPCAPECSQPDEFSDDERLTMLRLPRREYLQTVSQAISLYVNLIAILFSAAYDTRTTLADPTTESAWTISVLTSAFASLSTPQIGGVESSCSLNHGAASALRDVLVSSYSRALVYPLYRSFILCERCRLDVADILERGRRGVLRCLLKIKSILDKHEAYYIYSKIWIDDYCVWIQNLASEETLQFLSVEVRNATLRKRDLGWDLEGLETIACETLERASDSDDEDDEVERMQPAVL